jgi:hypothetical protein
MNVVRERGSDVRRQFEVHGWALWDESAGIVSNGGLPTKRTP